MLIPILTGNGYPGWPGIAQQREKLNEEVKELQYELERKNVQEATNEAFDVILTVVNVLERLKDINPQACQCGYTDFITKIQQYAKERNWHIEEWLEVKACHGHRN